MRVSQLAEARALANQHGGFSNLQHFLSDYFFQYYVYQFSFLLILSDIY